MSFCDFLAVVIVALARVWLHLRFSARASDATIKQKKKKMVAAA